VRRPSALDASARGVQSNLARLTVWSGRSADTSLERALYEHGSLIRMLGIRRTVFVVPSETAPVVQSVATAGVAAEQRRLEAADRLTAWLTGRRYTPGFPHALGTQSFCRLRFCGAD
jgi:hypothetical protein